MKTHHGRKIAGSCRPSLEGAHRDPTAPAFRGAVCFHHWPFGWNHLLLNEGEGRGLSWIPVWHRYCGPCLHHSTQHLLPCHSCPGSYHPLFPGYPLINASEPLDTLTALFVSKKSNLLRRERKQSSCCINFCCTPYPSRLKFRSCGFIKNVTDSHLFL